MRKSLLPSLVPVLLAIAGCVAASGDAPPDDGFVCTGKCDAAEDGTPNMTFEYIVVGAGAGGGTVASALARMNHTVLLVEAGPFEANPRDVNAIPALHPQASEDPATSWQYFVDHYGDRGRQQADSKYQGLPTGNVFYPRGATLGGSTAVNAMIAVYPHESDWNGIVDATGDTDYQAWQMRQYFTDIEDNGYLRLLGREGHGFDGWLPTHRADSTLALRDLKILDIVKGAASTTGSGRFLGGTTQLLGLMNRDLNAYGAERDRTEGLFTIPMSTTDRGRRSGVRERILDTVAQGFPLTIWTDSLVSHVNFDPDSVLEGRPRATGVEILQGAHMYRADRNAAAAPEPTILNPVATREVIVSAGAFNTPQVLMLSGIGPRAELGEHGIDVKVPRDGVGQNLQDRYEVPIISRASSRFDLVSGCAFDVNNPDRCYTDWRDRGTGVYTSNGGVVGMVRRSPNALTADPDLFIFGLPGAFRGYYPQYSRDVVADPTLFTWLVLKAHNANRGSVELRSADPRDTPIINFRYFGDPANGVAPSGQHAQDLESVIDGMEAARRAMDEANDSTLIASYEEIWPGRDAEPTAEHPRAANTREELGRFAMDESWGHHASCTAPMGLESDTMSVVDSKFRVHGVDGLRVVDASVFPRIPGFFPVVAVMMLGEKAAQDIHEASLEADGVGGI